VEGIDDMTTRFASGGYVEPPKTYDTMPQVILKGEYWVNAETYARYRDIFKAMGFNVRPYPEVEPS
jgi:aspartate/tyrosine/aromatic aminotransferase